MNVVISFIFKISCEYQNSRQVIIQFHINLESNINYFLSYIKCFLIFLIIVYITINSYIIYIYIYISDNKYVFYD